MKTQTEVRNAFWEAYPQFAAQRRSKKRQNDYSTDIRVSFCDFVDHIRNNGEISESLAYRVSL